MPLILLSTAGSHKLSATFAFNAIRFQPSLTSNLLLAFTDLERRPIIVAIKDMLGQSYKLGRHTDIFVLTVSKGGALQVLKYIWTHIDFRLWGGFLPIDNPMPKLCASLGLDAHN